MGFFTGINKRSQVTRVTTTANSKNKETDPFTCRYCGQVGFIGPCLFSPSGVHMALLGSPDKCVYCGLGAYGHTCEFSPESSPSRLGPHRHGHDGKRCIYCGLENVIGKSCSFGPGGYHSL